MRFIIITIFAFSACISAKAQTIFPDAAANNFIARDSNRVQKNWSVSTYMGFVGGTGLLYNRNAFFAPAIGVQLNRRLTNNLYAFTGVSVAPAFFYNGGAFGSTGYKDNFMGAPGFYGNQWGISKSIQAGLMYVNDAKTFSISGSIGVSRNSNPFYPAPQKQSGNTIIRQ